MFDDSEPLEDAQKLVVPEQSRSSIRSFWFAAAGLAILSHTSVLLLLLSNFGMRTLLFHNNYWASFFGTRVSWRVIELVELNVRLALMPSLVMASVLPIFLWRGGVSWRTAISLSMVLCCFGLGSDVWSWRIKDLYDEVSAWFLIVVCWTTLPPVFLLPAFNRLAKLRLVVACGLILLTWCIAITQMEKFPDTFSVLSWLAYFSVALVVSVALRNYAKYTLLEASAISEDVDGTSSKTMLELMSFSGLACAILASWRTQRFDTHLVVELVAACFLAALSILLVFWMVHSVLTERMRFRAAFYLLWLMLAALLPIPGIALELRDMSGAWFTTLVSRSYLLFALGAGIAGATTLFVYALVCAHWIKMCGWWMAKAETKSLG